MLCENGICCSTANKSDTRKTGLPNESGTEHKRHKRHKKTS